ncbi:hypothetical protein Q9233_011631 [Columba guinea]|nr:hypothetical protein Q9233_011631 [Columba guinea]
MAIMRSSVAEFKGHREALETLYIWTGVRISDKEGVGGCCEDKEKVDAEVQRSSSKMLVVIRVRKRSLWLQVGHMDIDYLV